MSRGTQRKDRGIVAVWALLQEAAHVTEKQQTGVPADYSSSSVSSMMCSQLQQQHKFMF